MSLQKLNFGCGRRIASGWVNIDLSSFDALAVQRVNLLQRLPFPDARFDAAYSSHVLEHFTREQARALLGEVHRVLRPGGVVRVVVPDLEASCREYLRVLALPDGDPRKGGQYEWVLIELLDQLVRATRGGEMGVFLARLGRGDDPALVEYVRLRVGATLLGPPRPDSLLARLRRLTPEGVVTRSRALYLKAVSRLIPRDLRRLVLLETDLGERHRWMYDRYGLQRLLEGAGFTGCEPRTHDASAIPGFTADALDSDPDGSAYIPGSLYMEARRP